MTLQAIQKELRPRKPVTDRQVRRYLRIFSIAPVGIRQRPQQYPDNAAQLILLGLGLVSHNGKAKLRRAA